MAIQMGHRSYSATPITCRLNLSNVIIGKYCSIAPNVVMDCGFHHNTKFVSTFPFNVLVPGLGHLTGHPVTKGDIVIGNDVWIGENAMIMSGVHIGDGAVIGTRSVVTKNVDPYSIVGGVPAKLIRQRFPKEIIQKLLQLKWWDWSDEKVFERAPLLMSERYEELFALEGV